VKKKKIGVIVARSKENNLKHLQEAWLDFFHKQQNWSKYDSALIVRNLRIAFTRIIQKKVFRIV
jgi:hypothetical protein